MENTSAKRLAIVKLPLSDAQIRYVFETSGAKVTEALVAGYVSSPELLQNEITGDDAAELAKQLWENNTRFVKNLNSDQLTKESFERHCGHHIDPDVPNFAMLR